MDDEQPSPICLQARDEAKYILSSNKLNKKQLSVTASI